MHGGHPADFLHLVEVVYERGSHWESRPHRKNDASASAAEQGCVVEFTGRPDVDCSVRVARLGREPGAIGFDAE